MTPEEWILAIIWLFVLIGLIYWLVRLSLGKMYECIVLVGLPASGKTTYIKNKYETYGRLSPDDIRFKLLDYVNSGIDFDPKIEPDVWETFFAELEYNIENRMSFYVDATNTNYSRRYPIISRALKAGYYVKIIYVKVPLEVALERNKNRDRKVPEDVIKRMHEFMKEPESWECHKLEIINETDLQMQKVQEVSE